MSFVCSFPACFFHFFFCFFFQAEDGIRDWSVTGVQTCALPISQRRQAKDARGGGDHPSPPHRHQLQIGGEVGARGGEGVVTREDVPVGGVRRDRRRTAEPLGQVA